MSNAFQYPVTSRAREVGYISPPAPTLVINGNADESSYEVRYNGVAVSSLDWGDIWLGQRALYKRFDIVNTGQTTLIVSGAELIAFDSHFSIYENVLENSILFPGETTTVVMTIQSEVLADLGSHSTELVVSVAGLASKHVVSTANIAFYVSANGDDSTPVFIEGGFDLNGGVPENSIFSWELKIHNAEGRYPLELNPDIPVAIGNYYHVSVPPDLTIAPGAVTPFTITVLNLAGLHSSNLYIKQINPTFQTANFQYGDFVQVTILVLSNIFTVDTSALIPYDNFNGASTNRFLLWLVTGAGTRHLVAALSPSDFVAGSTIDLGPYVLADSVVASLPGTSRQFFIGHSANGVTGGVNTTFEYAMLLNLVPSTTNTTSFFTVPLGLGGGPDYPVIAPIAPATASLYPYAFEGVQGVTMPDYRASEVHLKVLEYPPPDF